MITEDYVSFETAKLLKEKGFDVYVKSYYNRAAEFNGDMALWNYNISDFRHSAPTLQMAMKWVQETFNIIIIPNYEYECTSTPWCYKIFRLGENGKPKRVAVKGVSYDMDNNPTEHIVGYRDYELSYKDYATKEEACEAAIKYCLKNLIKNEDEEEESGVPVPKTVDEAVKTLAKIVSKEDRDYLLKNGAISMHDSLGRWIRNEWGLWTDSELKNELEKKGFEHPDDMSNYIIEEFIKYWNNKI